MPYGTQPENPGVQRSYAPPPPDTLERNPQIAQELGSFEKAAAVLYDRVAKLYSRLTPILSTSNEGQGQTSRDVSEPCRCQLADSLNKQVKIIEIIDAGVSDMLHRLEL